MNALWQFAEQSRHDLLSHQRRATFLVHESRNDTGQHVNLRSCRGLRQTGIALATRRVQIDLRADQAQTCGWLPIAAAQTCAQASWAVASCCLCMPENSSAARWARKLKPSTITAMRLLTRWANSSSPNPCPPCLFFFWNDPQGKRYRESYFEMYPGIWRHGDWVKITSRGSAIIYGRSDSTINRKGIRMGSSEIYRVVEDVPEVLDSLIIGVETSRRSLLYASLCSAQARRRPG